MTAQSAWARSRLTQQDDGDPREEAVLVVVELGQELLHCELRQPWAQVERVCNVPQLAGHQAIQRPVNGIQVSVPAEPGRYHCPGDNEPCSSIRVGAILPFFQSTAEATSQPELCQE